MTRTGDREIRSVSGRLPDNPGELACMPHLPSNPCPIIPVLPIGFLKKGTSILLSNVNMSPEKLLCPGLTLITGRCMPNFDIQHKVSL